MDSSCKNSVYLLLPLKMKGGNWSDKRITALYPPNQRKSTDRVPMPLTQLFFSSYWEGCFLIAIFTLLKVPDWVSRNVKVHVIFFSLIRFASLEYACNALKQIYFVVCAVITSGKMPVLFTLHGKKSARWPKIHLLAITFLNIQLVIKKM